MAVKLSPDGIRGLRWEEPGWHQANQQKKRSHLSKYRGNDSKAGRSGGVAALLGA